MIGSKKGVNRKEWRVLGEGGIGEGEREERKAKAKRSLTLTGFYLERAAFFLVNL